MNNNKGRPGQAIFVKSHERLAAANRKVTSQRDVMAKTIIKTVSILEEIILIVNDKDFDQKGKDKKVIRAIEKAFKNITEKIEGLK